MTASRPLLRARHVDLASGVAAIAWAVLAVDAGDGPLVPQLAALCSAYVAGGFGFAALGRWYNNRRKDGGNAAAS